MFNSTICPRFRHVRKTLRKPAALLGLVLAACLTAPFTPSPAHAETDRLGGLYTITVGGLTIGQGTVSLILQDNAYSAKVSLQPSGVGSLVSTGMGGAEASGWLLGEKVLPSTYEMASRAANRDFYVNFQQGSGNIRRAEVAPRFKPNPERIKVTRKHLDNAMDPLSAALLYVPSTNDTFTEKACDRTLQVFDGWTRFNIKMAYEGTRTVSGHGYDGKVVVCSGKWIPIAGHRPSMPSVKYMEKAHLEAWYAPLGQGGVLIPYRLQVPTMTGQMVVQATKLNIDENSSDHASR